MARAKKIPKVSVFNWMWTLLLCSIPGVNVLAILCFMFFAKNPSKKSFAVAVFLWSLIAVIAAALLLFFLPEQSAELAEMLRQLAAQQPAVIPAP